jgi:hypothetical protein
VGVRKFVQLGFTGDLTEESVKISVMGGPTHSVCSFPPRWAVDMMTGKTYSFFSNPVSLSVACLNLVDPASRPSSQFAAVLERVQERSSTCGSERDRQWENFLQAQAVWSSYSLDIYQLSYQQGVALGRRHWSLSMQTGNGRHTALQGKAFGVK